MSHYTTTIVNEPNVSKMIGKSAARLLGQIQWWCAKNAETGRNFINNHTWTFWTIRPSDRPGVYSLMTHLGWSAGKVLRAVKKLTALGVLVSARFRGGRDVTYYRIDHQALAALVEAETGMLGEANGHAQEIKTGMLGDQNGHAIRGYQDGREDPEEEKKDPPPPDSLYLNNNKTSDHVVVEKERDREDRIQREIPGGREPNPPTLSPGAALLVGNGMSRKQADILAAQHSYDRLVEVVEMLCEERSRQPVPRPGGWLYRALTEGWEPSVAPEPPEQYAPPGATRDEIEQTKHEARQLWIKSERKKYQTFAEDAEEIKAQLIREKEEARRIWIDKERRNNQTLQESAQEMEARLLDHIEQEEGQKKSIEVEFVPTTPTPNPPAPTPERPKLPPAPRQKSAAEKRQERWEALSEGTRTILTEAVLEDTRDKFRRRILMGQAGRGMLIERGLAVYEKMLAEEAALSPTAPSRPS